MSPANTFGLDPVQFYTGGINLDLSRVVPGYDKIKPATDYMQLPEYPREPIPPQEKPKDFGDYIGAAADLAEGIGNAVRAFKGYPARTQGGFRPAGNRFGEFMRLLGQLEAKNQQEDPRLNVYKDAIKSIFEDPDVLSDFIVRAEELKNKKKGEGSSPSIGTGAGASAEYFGHADVEAAKAGGATNEQIAEFIKKNPNLLRGGNVAGGGGLYDEYQPYMR